MPVENATVYLSAPNLPQQVGQPAQRPDGRDRGGRLHNLDASSLQAGGGVGNFTILDVQYRLYYPEPVGGNGTAGCHPEKDQQLNDSIMDLDYTTQAINNRKEVLRCPAQLAVQQQAAQT